MRKEQIIKKMVKEMQMFDSELEFNKELMKELLLAVCDASCGEIIYFSYVAADDSLVDTGFIITEC